MSTHPPIELSRPRVLPRRRKESNTSRRRKVSFIFVLMTRTSLSYDFAALVAVQPALSAYVIDSGRGHKTIDFADPDAVRALNIALLKKDYRLKYYDLPPDSLVPAVPGRWQYIDAVARLFIQEGAPAKAKMHLLDIGTGANVIYPLLAHQRLRWSAVGSDISQASLAHAQQILDDNGIEPSAIRLVHQGNPQHVLRGIIDDIDYTDVVVFNPPFYDTATAQKANTIKSSKLGTGMGRNFGGKTHEIACDGGELRILTDYISESTQYPDQVYWYTTLVSQGKNLKTLTKILDRIQGVRYDIIPLDTNNKKARILFWSFLSPKQAKAWLVYRWRQ